MKLLIKVSLILFLTSCTITKRHFGPGYHIEWKSSVSSQKSNSETGSIDSNSGLKVDAESVESGEESLLDLKVFENNTAEAEKLAEPNLNKPALTTPINCKQDKLPEAEEPIMVYEKNLVTPNQDDPEDDTTVPKKMEKSTWFSLLFFFLIGIMTAIFSMSGFLLTVGATAILFGLALGMFITSLIAVIRILRNPDRYKNRVLSFTVFFFSCTLLAIGLIAFVAVGLSEINFF
jgi:hypothetical protein